jgi:hypothetical protein
MRRIAFGVALAGVGLLAVRALAPRVHARLLAACERMFEEMPESFPPKRMMRGIEEISANSARTLELLEGELLRTASANSRSRRSTATGSGVPASEGIQRGLGGEP